jgi:hypothetical protein
LEERDEEGMYFLDSVFGNSGEWEWEFGGGSLVRD